MQDYITYIVVTLAVYYAVSSLVKIVISAYKKNKTACIGCAGGCEMKNV